MKAARIEERWVMKAARIEERWVMKAARIEERWVMKAARIEERWVMDWDDLRIFLSVARTESLSAAGRALHIDPATVGRRIARLEQAIHA